MRSKNETYIIVCSLLEMDVQEKHMTHEGGRVCLNEEGTILLDVPTGAFSEGTVVTCKSVKFC